MSNYRFYGIIKQARRLSSPPITLIKHETLVATGVTDYSRDELTTDYKLGTLFALWVVPIAVANLDMSSDYAQKLISNVVTNKFSAALDHGATEILDSL